MSRRLIWKVLLILAVLGISIYFAFPLKKRINLGLDLQGGMHILLKVDTSKIPEKDREDAADRALEIIRNRIDEFGVREPSIQRQGVDEIVVQLPGITDRQRALELIGKTALLEFKLVSNDEEKIRAALEGNIPEGYELKTPKDGSAPLLLESKPLLTGDALSSARVGTDEHGLPDVELEFNPEGAKLFAEITRKNINRQLAIVLDGVVFSAPVINSAIEGGKAEITKRFGFSIDEAADLALILRSGALPAPMYIEEERTIGPLLGQDSIRKGVRASIIGAALVLIFMAIYYLVAGLVADLALVFNFLLILGGLGMLPLLAPGVSATLTLPGIAGIVLSLGMAVDANVLINERIREERQAGKSLFTAIENGYSRAFSAILDSNITTLIAAVLLFQFGTGPIRGFAVTLTIGLLASMFTAIVVTRTIMEVLLHFGILKSLPMLRLIKETKIDFIAKRKICYLLSLIVIGAGLFSFFKLGKDAYGIDFTGGQIQEYAFSKVPSIETIRSVLKELNLQSATVQQFKDNPKIVLIRTVTDKSELLSAKLKEAMPDNEIQILRIERVGPVAGRHLQTKAVNALLWSLIGILIYVAFRFKHFNFAIAGVLALFHDVAVALGAMAIFGKQIDLLSVTAFLTIAGYSINDTIVIYDRVRENKRLNRKLSLRELINLSVNQSLSRTILTTFITLLTVMAILFYGGEVLSNFAFTLLVGFISGVYSTIYIASPLVLAWSSKGARK